jgi:hypothetical protein
VDKLLECESVYTDETKGDLRSESRKVANSRVTLVKHDMLMGLPKSCKRYGNGASVVAAKFYTTTVIRSEGEGEQSISCTSLDRSKSGLNKGNTY